MVVTCPHCSRRYMLDDALLPQEGRQVRCIACHHVWRQSPHISLQPSLPPLRDGASLELPMNVTSERSFSWMGLIAFIGILFTGISTFIFGRNYIVSYWPEGEKYYELVGLQVNLPGSGLSIMNATSQMDQNGDSELIRVMGNVMNTSSRVRPIPPLKIKLMGDNSHPNCLEREKEGGCILDHWEHRLSEQSLLPGEKIHFETEPRPKVQGTQHIRVEF